jgi:hypothetical protein
MCTAWWSGRLQTNARAVFARLLMSIWRVMCLASHRSVAVNTALGCGYKQLSSILVTGNQLSCNNGVPNTDSALSLLSEISLYLLQMLHIFHVLSWVVGKWTFMDCAKWFLSSSDIIIQEKYNSKYSLSVWRELILPARHDSYVDRK